MSFQPGRILDLGPDPTPDRVPKAPAAAGACPEVLQRYQLLEDLVLVFGAGYVGRGCEREFLDFMLRLVRAGPGEVLYLPERGWLFQILDALFPAGHPLWQRVQASVSQACLGDLARSVNGPGGRRHGPATLSARTARQQAQLAVPEAPPVRSPVESIFDFLGADEGGQ